MPNWSLRQLLASLHEDIQQRLDTVRRSIAHAPSTGTASERVWLELFETYLPRRYEVCSAHVVDSKGVFSEQIDVVVFDRQYSPLIFKYQGQTIVPAESVYAIFEAKQTLNAKQIGYAREKVASVRSLYRTSVPIHHAGGIYDPKPLTPILGGILALESDWKPPLGLPLLEALQEGEPGGDLDLGCVAAHGVLARTSGGDYSLATETKPATAFLFELIARLQALGTVPQIDIRAYSEWLLDPPSVEKVLPGGES